MDTHRTKQVPISFLAIAGSMLDLLVPMLAISQGTPLHMGSTGREPPSMQTVRIGGRTWMARNLDVVTYRNGDSIPRVSDTREWESLEWGAWCLYDNDGFNLRTFGRLYNWKAVADPRGLCPVGWHVPDSEEWSTLADSLGGYDYAGAGLKNRVNWALPNQTASNPTGFDANPGGFRYENGFSHLGEMGYWWCSDDEDALIARSVALVHREAGLYPIGSHKPMGLSVRCVKDDR